MSIWPFKRVPNHEPPAVPKERGIMLHKNDDLVKHAAMDAWATAVAKATNSTHPTADREG